eukprot:NODE_966_length_1739_cov_39.885236_g906_i0.p1 GENE.NODE_966_length_1739_cov_39.885236_g906_i0~~NODE_966_length_1739_cov_39.885236_g906_i0.p1  ORF type:complete len:349 (-),score=102.74 NODE_966_length_1739_cov_39.885236_g906_i0:53-1099(-)
MHSRHIPEEELRFAISQDEYRPSLTLAQWRAGLQRAGVGLTDSESELLFKHLDKTGDDTVDYLEWTARVNTEILSEHCVSQEPEDLLLHQLVVQLATISKIPLLTKEEAHRTQLLVNRLSRIAEEASSRGVRILIDAEQTYMQVAIDHFTIKLQAQCNRDRAVVFNTYQCYLNFSQKRVLNDMERARRDGWVFGLKLVRGAYMVQERALAADRGYQPPILPTAQATHDNFNECLQLALVQCDQERGEIVVATHNQQSIERCVQRMEELNMDSATSNVFFAQLLGMADHLSLSLGAAGYQVFKYVPYGPVGEVMPYLIRRAQENSGLMEGAQFERNLLWQELLRRLRLR